MDKLVKINLVCKDIEKEIGVNSEDVSAVLMRLLIQLGEFIREDSEDIKEYAVERLHPIALYCSSLLKVWMYSVLIAFTQKADIMEEFIEYIVTEDRFGPHVKYFLYYQLLSKTFENEYLENENTIFLKWKLVEKTKAAFKKEVKDLLTYIPYEQRNSDMVFIITDQILSKRHAPTIIALEQCKFFVENMHKNVLLINTAEFLTQVGKVPYYLCKKGNYNESNLTKQFMVWKGTEITFFQCENNMPNMTDLRELLQVVRKVKPGLVISIGGNSMVANLIDDLIPVLSYGLTSEIQTTMTSCQTLCREINHRDIRILKRIGINKSRIIQILPKVSMYSQRTVVTRKKLGLPENKFITVIIGNRLNSDIDEAFLHMLSCALDEDMAAAFIGFFPTYEKYMLKMPELKEMTYNLGYTDDLLAWIEVCDLYINPHRLGGGTSAVAAMFKGLPVVTTMFGDVAACVGEEFCTDSYASMVDLIKRYKENKDFYQKMSILAKKKSDTLIDNPENYQKLIIEFQKRTGRYIESEEQK